jgi:ribosome biogenesis GTPase / thiamine phosphate phosphatase
MRNIVMVEFKELGFNKFFQKQYEQNTHFTPAKITNVERGHYSILNESGPATAVLAGRFEYLALSPNDYPSVGDWVLLRPSVEGETQIIEQIMDRFSRLVRMKVGSSGTVQIIAVNVDYVFIVQSCNADFNPRRLERYMAAVAESGAEAVIVLNKSDLDLEATINFEGLKVHRVSAESGENIAVLEEYLQPGMTAVLVGSSGVGKSTLINRLCGGESQKTQSVRGSDDKGRHTTTSRQLFFATSGGMIIDTPGMREFGIVEGDTVATGLFDDINALAKECRYSNCTHENDKGCAIQEAISKNELDIGKFKSFNKLKREEEFHARKEDVVLEANARKHRKKFSKSIRQKVKNNPKCR